MTLKRHFLVPFGVTLVFCCVGNVFAQEMSQEWKWCAGRDGAVADLQIGGCTTVIQSGRETTENLAIAFHNRGIAYDSKGDHDRAIQDYDQAIKLDPQYTRAFINRGAAYKRRATRTGRSRTTIRRSSSTREPGRLHQPRERL